MALDILPMLLASWEYRRSFARVAEVGASVLVLFISKRRRCSAGYPKREIREKKNEGFR